MLLRVRLLEVEAGAELLLVVAAAKETDVGIAELVVEVVVGAKDSDVLAGEVEVGDAAETGLHDVADWRARAGPLAVQVEAVARPAEGIVNRSGVGVEGLFPHDRGRHAADV